MTTSSTDVERRHGDGCGCVRCRGFQRGNVEASKTATHGAYADLQLSERVATTADSLVPFVPAYQESDWVHVQLLAVCLERIKAAVRALEAAEPGDLERLRRLDQDLGTWTTRASKIANALAMSPTARGRLGLDVAVARRQDTLTSLAASAAAERELEAGE